MFWLVKGIRTSYHCHLC